MQLLQLFSIGDLLFDQSSILIRYGNLIHEDYTIIASSEDIPTTWTRQNLDDLARMGIYCLLWECVKTCAKQFETAFICPSEQSWIVPVRKQPLKFSHSKIHIVWFLTDLFFFVNFNFSYYRLANLISSCNNARCRIVVHNTRIFAVVLGKFLGCPIAASPLNDGSIVTTRQEIFVSLGPHHLTHNIVVVIQMDQLLQCVGIVDIYVVDVVFLFGVGGSQ